MNLWAIEVFCKVVELRSFSRAAEAVRLSQPTVSGHVKGLEEELGLRLLQRSSTAVRPTQAGEILCAYGKRMLLLREEARAAIGAHKAGLQGHLVVGSSSIPGAYILPGVVARFKAAHPGVTIALEARDSREIVRGVADGRYELGLVGARFPEARVRYARCGEDELVLAVPADHPWAARPRLALRELAGQPLVMREEGSGSRKTLEASLRASGVRPDDLRVVVEMTGNEAIRQAVKAGLGMAVISCRAVADDVRSGSLAALRFQGARMRRDFFLVTHRTAARSPAAAAFGALLLAEAARGRRKA
jgi:DNA-binding transcriptional LysR family regulator